MAEFTRPDIIREIAHKVGLSQDRARVALNTTLDTIAESVNDGHKVKLLGFGSFEKLTRAARSGRNPKTGERIEIPESKRVVFKPSKNL